MKLDAGRHQRCFVQFLFRLMPHGQMEGIMYIAKWSEQL